MRGLRIFRTIFNAVPIIGYYVRSCGEGILYEANSYAGAILCRLMMKLGLVRFSMLLALALVVLAIVVQMAVTMVLHGQVESIDVIRSIFLAC